MSSNDVFLTPATAAGATSIQNLTWDQFLRLVANELVSDGLINVPGPTGPTGPAGSDADATAAIEAHRIDTTDVHGVALTVMLQRRFLERATGIIVPMYLYPANIFTNPDFDGVIDAAKTYHRVPFTVVLNPATGPGTVADGNYTVGIRRLKGANIGVLGYILSSHAAQPIADAKDDIDTWISLYPTITGLFIDQMTNADSAPSRAYYAELTAYAHAKGLFPVVANAGTAVGAAYFTENTADVIIIHEAPVLPSEVDLKGNFDGGFMDSDYRRRGVLAYDIDPTGVEDAVEMMAKYVGMVYVTEEAGNPWGVISSYLDITLGRLNII